VAPGEPGEPVSPLTPVDPASPVWPLSPGNPDAPMLPITRAKVICLLENFTTENLFLFYILHVINDETMIQLHR